MQRRRSASPTDLEELTVDDRAHYKGSFPYSKGCLGAFADMSSVVCRGARRKARANRVFQDCGGGRIFGGTELLFFLGSLLRFTTKNQTHAIILGKADFRLKLFAGLGGEEAPISETLGVTLVGTWPQGQ